MYGNASSNNYNNEHNNINDSTIKTVLDTWYKEKLAQKDRVHFTIAGYQLIGNLFTNALFDAYKRHAESLKH